MSDYTIFIGVDPGLGGAIALYEPETGAAHIVDTIVRPIAGVRKGATIKREFDAGAVARELSPLLADAHVGGVLVERVGSRPGQGGASIFSLGFSLGSVVAVLETLLPGVPLELVNPATWKGELGLTGSDKNRSRELAADLVPAAAHYLKRVKDHDRAEALLLAYYAAEKMC